MFKRLALVGIAASFALPASTVAASSRGHDEHSDTTIELPAEFAGEGVAVGAQNTFYAGSRTDGRVARGNLRAGTSEVFVDTPLVTAATGLKADLRHNLLWVSGAATGKAAVYNLKTGQPVAELTLTTAPSFINDVIVTRKAAFFTNSRAAEIYRVPVSRHGKVGAPETIALTGPAAENAGAFNLNGIEASKDGRTLIVVNSSSGKLFTVDTATGDSALIDVGGATFPTGDGILLRGRTLYVLQNGSSATGDVPNQINVIRLSHHLTVGHVVETITSELFETATTLARRGDLLVAVNAQFGGAPIDPESELVLLDRGGKHH